MWVKQVCTLIHCQGQSSLNQYNLPEEQVSNNYPNFKNINILYYSEEFILQI